MQENVIPFNSNIYARGTLWKSDEGSTTRMILSADDDHVHYTSTSFPGVRFKSTHPQWQRWVLRSDVQQVGS